MSRQIDHVLVSMSKFFRRDAMHVSCALNPGRETGEPFAYLTIGPISIHPDTTLLREIHAKIGRFLESDDARTLAGFESNRDDPVTTLPKGWAREGLGLVGPHGFVVAPEVDPAARFTGRYAVCERGKPPISFHASEAAALAAAGEIRAARAEPATA